MDYIIYCDESSDNGPLYTDFFGGCMVAFDDLQFISDALNAKKEMLHLFDEVKWSKVTSAYLNKYMDLIHLFFDFVRAGKLRVRIMFRNAEDSYIRSSHADKYFKLYYQFIKHSFGLMRAPNDHGQIYVRIYLDELPDKSAKRTEFKQFLMNMPNTADFHDSPVRIREGDIAEVRSHDHVILQCTDIVLGAMFFRLNRLHKVIPEGKNRRGSRTVAKDRLYTYICQEIRSIYPGFNIGVSTGWHGSANPHWENLYEHFLFRSSEIK